MILVQGITWQEELLLFCQPLLLFLIKALQQQVAALRNLTSERQYWKQDCSGCGHGQGPEIVRIYRQV